MANDELDKLIVRIPDYPQPPVIFEDVTPVFQDPEGFQDAVKKIADHFRDAGITKIVGPEARGFLIGAPVAYELGVGFVPARKPGKLPRETVSASYELEYGTDTLEIHTDALNENDVVLIVDDLVASGGTVSAVGDLVQKFGAKLAGYAFIIELAYLNPRKVLAEHGDQEVFSLVVRE